VVVGYVHDVKPGGLETVNCKARDQCIEIPISNWCSIR